MHLKKIDQLLITSFLPPFVVTFFIALFVLVMQTLWLYIDDIAGKGVGFFLMVELVGYMSVSMIPMALPVAVLISSVMVLGNLAERYELPAIKSAGVSLWRVMLPLMVVTILIGIFSFFCSNYFIPVSNLKFKSRLHDIKNQKPTLSLEESLFNDDFQGYSIRIGDKDADHQTIRDVMLFDNRDANKGQLSMVAADSGQMFGSLDGKYFVMHLYQGNQISKRKPSTKDGKRNYPMMRASFKEWTKVFNLDEFELDRTDENLFKSHHTMLSNRQLLVAIDSIDQTINDRIKRFDEQTNRYFFFFEKAELERKKEERQLEAEKRRKEIMSEIESGESTDDKNAGEQAGKQNFLSPREEEERRQKIAAGIPTQSAEMQDKNPVRSKPAVKPTASARNRQTAVIPSNQREPLQLEPDRDISEYTSIAETFPLEKRRDYIDKAKGSIRTIIDQSASSLVSIKKTAESRVKHVFEFHSKFSMALACFIFLFVGAPMGAIVRKGGFGWPLLIAIIFFMLFIIISIFSKNIAERFVIDAVLASWMNCLIVFPMGLLLTYWAMRDMGWTQIVEFFSIRLPFRKS